MSGDHPTTPLRSQPVDVVAWLRCEADAAAREPAPWEMLFKAASEIERLRAERDEARRRTNSILTEIDCRIEHGAESNGHLEAIRSLFKESNDE